MVSVRITREVDGVPGTSLYEVLDDSGQLVSGPRVALVGNMHGNEPVGGMLLDRLEPKLPAHLTRGSVLCVRANLQATALGVRHTVGGTDLNRLWDAESQRWLRRMPERDRCYEHRRALEIAPLLEQADAILDMHSTSQPSPPFLVFRDDQQHAMLGRTLGVRRMVTGLHEDAILRGGMCPDVGLELGARSRRLGFTLEAGQHDDPANAERAWLVVLRFLHYFNLWDEPVPPPERPPEIFEVIDRFRQSSEGRPPFEFVSQDPSTGRELTLESFVFVNAGQMLMRRSDGVVIRASSRFLLLLPNPYATPGTDLYYMAIKRRVHREAGHPLTHEVAHVEAQAIERTLDLLDDDELSDGATWAAFHSRQVLDQCADMVLRTLRLPKGHPHRKLTVLGRGDWGTGGSEHAAARRYRRAMQRAMIDGIDITRLQVLRGASMGWLDALTSDRMSKTIARRLANRQDRGLEGTGVRLYMSVRQPPTLSVLVAGDLARALDEGNSRHVRVAFVVEAPSVEADRGQTRVQIARMGLISARPEFLRTVVQLVQQVRDEHMRLFARPFLRDDPRIQAHSSQDGALLGPSTAKGLSVLGGALSELQHRLWVDALTGEVESTVLRDDDEVGQWLAQLMVRAGILDADGLRRMFLRPCAEGVRVVPEGLQRFDHQPAQPSSALRRLPPLRPPLSADDVDADSLQRWVGWKRFLRRRQVLPDNRGRDVDLAVTEAGIQTRVAEWFHIARRMADEAPGRVKVVVSGDGLRPEREHPERASALLRSHRTLVLDPRIHYLRIQHAQGTHLGWMRDLVHALERRPDGPGSFSIQWEGSHGSAVNVVLIAVRPEAAGPIDDPWNLDGWQIVRCGVVVAELGEHSSDYQIGLFTEPTAGRGGRCNEELALFGRAHCQGLLHQGGFRVSGGGAPSPGAVGEFVIEQLARWVERARAIDGAADPTDPAEDHAASLAGRLGLADVAFARALAVEARRGGPARQAAQRLWHQVEAWPGAALQRKAGPTAL